MGSNGCRFRVAFVVLLSVSGQAFSEIQTRFSENDALENDSAALSPTIGVDWYDGKDHTPYALGVSHWNFLRYYDEAQARYGDTPPWSERIAAVAGMYNFMLSNTLGDKYLGGNSPPQQRGRMDHCHPRNPAGKPRSLTGQQNRGIQETAAAADAVVA